MSETKFTKGEWKVHVVGSQFAVGPLSSNYDQSNGMMNVAAWIEKFDYFTEEQSKANAHLIAAAPEMYEILERLVDPSNCKKDIIHIIGNAESLLAEARGEK